jgi:acyl-CoA dehydrogenase
MLPFLDQDHSQLRARVRQWAEKNLFSGGGEERQTDDVARRLVRQLGNEGFLSYALPKKFGGVRGKVQARDLCVIREELARVWVLADTMFAVQALGSYPIALFGTEEQKQRYLPPLAKGTAIAAFALTEPEAGSDVAALKSRALRRDGEYVLTGNKRFISNAGIADSYVVFASTAPDLAGKGISAFVVDANNPGLIVKKRIQVISPHPIGMIAFEECVISESSLLGNQGDGLKIALVTLDLFRCTVGAAAVGLAQRAMEEALDYGRKRRQFDRPLTEFQGIQFKLAEMATELEAARLLVYQAAWAHDFGAADAKLKSSMAKLFATEAAQRIVDQALQIHGGMGVVAGSVMERLYRDVRALRIFEGTSEIQRIVIARSLLGKSRIED